jgi:hypothetical protein
MEPMSESKIPQAGTVPVVLGHSRPLNHDELLELGLLAVEEPGLPGAKPTPVVVPSPEPPAPALPTVPAEKVTTPEVAADEPASAARSTEDTPPTQSGPELPAAASATPLAPAPPVADQAITRMEMSANTHDLRSLSRLAALNTYMNLAIVLLIVAIVVGGVFVYMQLVEGDMLESLFR